EGDEVLVVPCDLDATRFGKQTIFDFARHRKNLEDALGIPVIDPTQAAVTMALGAVAFAG
ncbi:MAG: hypothetical protein ACK495_04955, partial [Bradyrhizobium sp.]